jgi:hypothetical protein
LSACFLRVVDQPLLFGDPLLKLFDQGRLSPMGALFARGLKPGLSVAEASKKQYLLFLPLSRRLDWQERKRR